MVVKRRSFFDYLRKTHEEGGFWLNCVRLKRQVRELCFVCVSLVPNTDILHFLCCKAYRGRIFLVFVVIFLSQSTTMALIVIPFYFLHEFSRFVHATHVHVVTTVGS